MHPIDERWDVALRWISLIVIAAILAVEAWLLFDRTLYGPLRIADWSGLVMTLDEKEQLFDQVRNDASGVTDVATGVEFAGLVRSVSEPRRVCGLFRHKSKSGLWASWRQFSIHYGVYGTFFGGSIDTASDPPKPFLYQRNGVLRELTPRDRVECEPVNPCEMCFGPAPPKNPKTQPN
jgi:hypothetical protein